jgi:hypothetical protein
MVRPKRQALTDTFRRRSYTASCGRTDISSVVFPEADAEGRGLPGALLWLRRLLFG